MSIKSYSRLYLVLSAILMNVYLYGQNADCTFYEDYENADGWMIHTLGPQIDCSNVPRGEILFEDGKLKWEAVRDGGYDTRNSYDLGFTLCDSWTAGIDITITAGGSGSVGPFSLTVMGLTSGSEAMVGYYVGSNILQADQDGIFTYLTSTSQNTWMFRVGLRDGTGFEVATTIPINTTYGVTYHVEMQRINGTSGYIIVTSDDFTPAFSSSACFDIPPTITDLTYFQQANTPTGSCERIFAGEMDNFCIKNCTTNPIDLITGTTEYAACSGTPVMMDLSEVLSGNSYQWIPATGVSNPNILNPTITVSQSTDYTVIATGDCGFTDTLLVSIDVNSTDGLDIIGESELTVCPGQPLSPDLTINPSGNSYSWEPTTGLSDPTILNPEITTSEPVTYILIATNPCTADATFELSVVIADPLDFELDSEITICKGDTIEIPGFLNSAGEVNWITSSSLSGLTIPNPLAFPTSTTEYNVTVSNECETRNESINIIVNDVPIISGNDQLNICAGDTAYANIHNTGNYEVTSWHWSPSTGIENTYSANPGIFNENDATYQIVANNSCGTDVFEVQLKTYVLDAILDLDSIICPGDPIELSAQGAATYAWYPIDAMDRPHDSVTTASIYTDQLIQLQLSGGTCVKMFSDFVHVYHDIGFSKLDPVHLFPGQLYDLSHYESEYGIVFSESPIVSFYADTTMTLIYTDQNGCEFSLYLPVTVEPTLYIPNSFTPDGDGLNDIFKAVGVNIADFELRIYNRYGKLVFQSHSLNHGWNGGIDGYYCPDDIYNYVVEYSYHDTDVKVKRGFVTLIR